MKENKKPQSTHSSEQNEDPKGDSYLKLSSQLMAVIKA